MITIVDYNAGNLRSVKRACDAVGIAARFTADPDQVEHAERLIFPGVGHAKTAMDTLARTGLAAALQSARARGVPILGICVGAQLLLDGSDEGPVSGFGWFSGRTRRLAPPDGTFKVPHIGWNEVRVTRPHPLLAPLAAGDPLYFLHAYYLAPSDPETVYAESDYGGPFCCALGKDNVFATQFHPEKSGRLGLAILERFARWSGSPC